LNLDELPSDENLARWHPDFDLQNIPDIDIASLPVSPDRQLLASPIEIRHFAERTPSERVKRALFSAFSSDDVSSTITLSSPKKEALSIDGISPSLIEKVPLFDSYLLALVVVLFKDSFQRKEQDLVHVTRPRQANALSSRANNWYHSAILHCGACDIAAIRSCRSTNT
jgi:hypothetical protein